MVPMQRTKGNKIMGLEVGGGEWTHSRHPAKPSWVRLVCKNVRAFTCM